MCYKTSRQGAGGPRLFAKKKNASALWRMMANEEIVMETVMLTITVTTGYGDGDGDGDGY